MPPARTSMTPTEWAMLIALSLLWGGSFFFNGVAVKELPPLVIVFARVALAAVTLHIVMAATGYLLGITEGREYAEPEWYVDLWLTLVWVAYLLVFLGTIFKREADNLLIKFGMREDRITSLSGGNQQKVLIGRGFAMRPDVIVLNDPARGIDVGAKNELYKHLRTFAGEGKSVVYMSSELEEFIGFATRVIVFRDGKPFDAFDGSTLDPKKVLEAMFGQTDGRGLDAPYGLKPTGRDADFAGKEQGAPVSTVDGVRVEVEVPSHIRDALEQRKRAAPVAPRPSAPAARPRTGPGETGGKAAAAARPIRIVEFDADSGEPRSIGR